MTPCQSKPGTLRTWLAGVLCALVAAAVQVGCTLNGDGDMIRPGHMVAFRQLLGGCPRDAGWQREHMPTHRLAVLPNLTHDEICGSPQLPSVVLPFLQDGAAR